MLKQYSGNIPLTACVLSQTMWFHLLLGTGYGHKLTFGLTHSSFSGAFTVFFDATKAITLPVRQVLDLSLVSSPTTGAKYGGKGTKPGCALPPLPSTSAALHQGAVKPADLNLPGVCWEYGERNSATHPNETALRCWRCWTGVDDLLHSGMLRDDAVLGTETICMKTNSTRESPGHQGVALHQEKTWKTAVFKSRLTLA